MVLYNRASAPWATRIGGGVECAKGGGMGGGVYSVFILKLRYSLIKVKVFLLLSLKEDRGVEVSFDL